MQKLGGKSWEVFPIFEDHFKWFFKCCLRIVLHSPGSQPETEYSEWLTDRFYWFSVVWGPSRLTVVGKGQWDEGSPPPHPRLDCYPTLTAWPSQLGLMATPTKLREPRAFDWLFDFLHWIFGYSDTEFFNICTRIPSNPPPPVEIEEKHGVASFLFC